ncbi:MAG: hypothetical protein ABR886_06430 [Dehalococcoidales bacterium]|jgi:hypothetical protein
MGNWNKNIGLYGNLNKLVSLAVILSIPIIIIGVFLWSKYFIARIIVWVVIGLLGIGLFAILFRWTMKSVGIKSLKINHAGKKDKESGHNYRKKRNPEDRQRHRRHYHRGH